MRAQPAAEEDRSAGLTPPIQPCMPWRVAEVNVLAGYRLHVRFIDGLQGTVDLSQRVHSKTAGVFAVLADSSLFAQVSVKLGAVTWPGEIDLAPDAMHRAIRGHGEWKLS